jgi:hypothetical protein
MLALVAVLDRTVTVILETVHTALRIFLHVPARNRIAIVVGVLLALAMAAAVVRGVVDRVHAVLTGLRLLVPRVPGARQLRVLRAKNETVWADGRRGRPARLNAAEADHENQHDCSSSHHAALPQQAALHLPSRDLRRQMAFAAPTMTAGGDQLTRSGGVPSRARMCPASGARSR